MDSTVDRKIGRALKQFDRGMYRDYVLKTEKMIKEYQEHNVNYSPIDLLNLELPDKEFHPSFSISLHEPVYITLSNPISMFRSAYSVSVGKSGEKHYTARLGLVPVFFSSLNMMSMLKLYSERAEKFFDQTSQQFTRHKPKCIQFSSKGGDFKQNPVKYSAMNVIGQETSVESLADDKTNDIFYDKYFTMGFWSFPTPGFGPSTHFVFGSKINAIFKITKSLYVIIEKGGVERIKILDREIEILHARVRGLNNGLYFSQPIDASIELGAFPEWTDLDPSSPVFLNAIMMEIRQPDDLCKSCKGLGTVNTDRFQRCGVCDGQKHAAFRKIITVVASHGTSYYDMLQSALGIVADYKYVQNQSVAIIDEFERFQKVVEMLCSDWCKHLHIPESLSESLENTFQIAFDSTFPMLISGQSKTGDAIVVYYVHPLVWGFLKKWNLIRTDMTEQRRILLLLSPLMEEISSLDWKERRRGVTHDPQLLELQKLIEKKELFLSSIIRLVSEIKLCNLIKKVQSGTDLITQ